MKGKGCNDEHILKTINATEIHHNSGYWRQGQSNKLLNIFEGFDCPPVLNIPITNVAESVDAMKKFLITKIVIIDKVSPKG